MSIVSVPTAPASATIGAPSHPEEMKAVFDMRVGKWITLQGSARITPAGVVCTGIAVSALLLATTALVRAARR